jgi:hypothetical protein
MKKRDKEDFTKDAFRVFQEAIGEKPSKNQIKAAMSYMGRMGGLKGGKARAESLSPDRRKEIARKAAQKRWNKND